MKRSIISLIVALIAASLFATAAPVAADPASHEAATSERAATAAQTIDEFFDRPDLHRGHSIVLRLYWAVLNRKPELGGAEFWIESYNSGEWDIRRIAAHFVVSQEFQDNYGETTNAEFVGLIYNNMLDRDPDPGGFDFWTTQLDAGMSRAEMVLLVSNDTEFIERRPLPSDERPDTGPGPYLSRDSAGFRAIEFFQATYLKCSGYAVFTGNPVPDSQRFDDATVVLARDDFTAALIQDGQGDHLWVDFDLPLDSADRNGSEEPTVVYSANGPDDVLPFTYSFGCPPSLYLGTLSS